MAAITYFSCSVSSFPSVGPTDQYMQKQDVKLHFGSRGSQPGHFTWPRGIAVGPSNTIVVADSSNHRVQVTTNTQVYVYEHTKR